MCDGGGGGDGGDATGQGADATGGNPGGGSGGNVGGGFGGGSGGTPTGRGDPAAFGNAPNAIGQALGGGGFYGGWEEASLSANQNPASTTGAFGFDSQTGAQTGFLSGSMFGGLPGGLIGGLLGGMMGVAQEGGNVDDYGGGDPDAGGGPLDTAGSLRPFNPKPPGWGEEAFTGDILSGGPGSVTPIQQFESERVAPRGFGTSTTPDTSSRLKTYGTAGSDDLLKTLVFNEDEFTKNLF